MFKNSPISKLASVSIRLTAGVEASIAFDLKVLHTFMQDVEVKLKAVEHVKKDLSQLVLKLETLNATHNIPHIENARAWLIKSIQAESPKLMLYALGHALHELAFMESMPPVMAPPAVPAMPTIPTAPMILPAPPASQPVEILTPVEVAPVIEIVPHTTHVISPIIPVIAPMRQPKVEVSDPVVLPDGPHTFFQTKNYEESRMKRTTPIMLFTILGMEHTLKLLTTASIHKTTPTKQLLVHILAEMRNIGWTLGNRLDSNQQKIVVEILRKTRQEILTEFEGLVDEIGRKLRRL